MKNPFTSLFRAQDKPQDSVSAAPTFYFGTSDAGKAVNAQTAIQLSTVYACVRVISETVASLPLGVFEAKESGNEKAMDHDDHVTSFRTFVYLNLWSDTDPTDMADTIREAMYAYGFMMLEESDKGYNQPAYDTATRQYTVQWTWVWREDREYGH